MQRFAYPIMIKIDVSSGGEGVFECHQPSDIDEIQAKLRPYPILIQRKILGETIDISGFFQRGKLIHFDYSVFYKTYSSPLGASVLRKYYPISTIEASVFDEVASIGAALGADGFVNITCILSQTDHKRYYVEADMRPNVWAGYSQYFTDNIVDRIKAYFERSETLRRQPVDASQLGVGGVLLPYFPRMRLWEILLNRYRCWKYWDNDIAIPLLMLWFHGYYNRCIQLFDHCRMLIRQPFV